MKAIAECPKCGKQVETDCKGCIMSGSSYHMCGDKCEVVDVEWKKFPENEKEIREFEESKS